MEVKRQHLPKRINNPQTKIKPAGIILHYVANPGTTAAANVSYFAHVPEQKSVHYIVDDNEIIEIIPPDFKSYGTSKKEYNESYIQIEMCHPDTTGRISEDTLKNVVWLCKKLMKDYGFNKIIRHYDATGKKCPLWYVNHPDDWEKLKERIFNMEPMTLEEAKKIVQEKTGLNEQSMQHLMNYIYREGMMIKLAEAMK